MSKITVTRTFTSAPAAVWALIGDPGAIAAWHPAIESSSLQGDLRTCVLADGAKVVERVTARGATSYTYTIVDAPLPITGYVSTLRADAAGSGTQVTWEASFEVNAGVPPGDIEGFLRGAYEAGLAAVAAALAR